MKIARVTCCLFVLLLFLVAFAFSTSAPRVHAASGTTFTVRFHGMSAVADFCTNTPLLSASGSTSNPNFQVGEKLLSASLNTTISVFDFVSGSTFNVAVSVAWTSTSAIGHEDSTSHFHTKAFTENAHFNADFRDANASGTVSDGTTNFTPSPSVFAQIMSVKDVVVSITHP